MLSLGYCPQQKGGFFLKPSKTSDILLILLLDSRLLLFYYSILSGNICFLGFPLLFKVSPPPFFPQSLNHLSKIYYLCKQGDKAIPYIKVSTKG